MARHFDAPTPSRRELMLGLMVFSLLGGVVLIRGGQPRISTARTADTAAAITSTSHHETMPIAQPKRTITTAGLGAPGAHD